MPKFIYVFDDDSRDKLIQRKYEMLKYDEHKHIYVFLNSELINFESEELEYALSDILTF